jgi:hypothetical protein
MNKYTRICGEIYRDGFESGYESAVSFMRCVLENFQEKPNMMTDEQAISFALKLLNELRDEKKRRNEPVPIGLLEDMPSRLMN